MQPNEPVAGNYFALLRILRKWRGGNAIRSEDDWREAYLTGVVIYLISYFFFGDLMLAQVRGWRLGLAWPLLLIGLWIFWLLVFYFNSLIAKAIWACGLASNLPARRVQSVLIGTLTTTFAAQLLTAGPWISWLGALWLVAVAANLAAALLLAIWYDERS